MFFWCIFLWYDLCFLCSFRDMICDFFCGMICFFVLFLWYDLCLFWCFFCGITCGPGQKKVQKNTKKHGDLNNFFEHLGWGAGSDEVGSRERQGEEPGAMGGEPEARGWSREPEPIWTCLSSCNHNLPSFLSFLFPLAVRARTPGHLLPFQS